MSILSADDALLARGLRGEKIRLGRLQVFQSLFRARHNAFVVHFDLALVEKQQRRVGVHKAERRALGAYVRGDEKAVGAFELLRDLRLGGLRDFGLLLRLGPGENVGDLRLGKPVLFREALGDAALGPLLAGLQRGEKRRCDILRFRRSRPAPGVGALFGAGVGTGAGMGSHTVYPPFSARRLVFRLPPVGANKKTARLRVAFDL